MQNAKQLTNVSRSMGLWMVELEVFSSRNDFVIDKNLKTNGFSQTNRRMGEGHVCLMPNQRRKLCYVLLAIQLQSAYFL